jgi:hypothetical protein
MNLEEAVVYILSADPGVAAITTTVRPYALWRADTLPALTYIRLSGDTWHHYQGVVPCRLARMQITANASTYSQAKVLAEAVNAAIDGYTGTVSGCEIGNCWLDNQFDQPQPPAGGKETPIHQVSLDFEFLYEEE